MRAARYSRAAQLGLALSFAAGAAWGTAVLFRTPASPTEVTLDIGDLRARAAALVAMFDAKARDALPGPYRRAQHRQWDQAVRDANKPLAAEAAHDGDAARAHDAAVELLRIGESLPAEAVDPQARDAAARITDQLAATERARKR